MSLNKIESASIAGGFLSKSLNTTMTRREFLAMGGALILSAIGVQNLINVYMKHTNNTSPNSLLTSTDPLAFGSRKFGQ